MHVSTKPEIPKYAGIRIERGIGDRQGFFLLIHIVGNRELVERGKFKKCLLGIAAPDKIYLVGCTIIIGRTITPAIIGIFVIIPCIYKGVEFVNLLKQRVLTINTIELTIIVQAGCSVIEIFRRPDF